MTVAVTQALADGARSVVCASTGNTAASAAAYAARAGLEAVILQPEGAVAAASSRRRARSARMSRCARTSRGARGGEGARGGRHHVLVNSLNPLRLQGQKTAAFEIVEELGGAPDVLALPYGGGGNLCAYALGFGETGSLPRFVAAQAANRAGTAASAIRIVEPAHRS